MFCFKAVKLLVYEPGGVDREGFPLTVGLPFSAGALWPKDGLAVTDSAGKSLPIQSRVLESHPDGSVRWLLLDFQGDLAHLRETTFTLSKSKKNRECAVENPLKIEEQADSLLIDNGPLKVEISKVRCQPLAKVYYRSKLISEGGLEVFITDCDGRKFSAEKDADARFEIEESGPLRTLMRWEGTHKDEAGQGLFDFLVRMWVYAGSPFVRIDHTFFNRLDPESIPLKNLAACLPIALGENPKYQVSDLKRVVTGFAAQEPVRLQQLQMGKYQILRANGELLKETRVNARGWIDVSGDNSGVMLAGKNFWQNFPKAMEAGPGYLEYQMIPELPQPHVIQRGLAKTHTFFFSFHDGQAETTDRAEIGHNLQRWPVPVAESRHYLDSGELFDYFGYFPKKYPRLETAFLKLLALDDPDHTLCNPAHGRCYGLKHYGDMVLTSPNNSDDLDHPETFFHNNEYDTAHVLAMMFLRNREICNFWIAEAHALHMMDIDTCYHDLDGSRVLPELTGPGTAKVSLNSQYEHSQGHTTIFAGHSHTFSEGLIDLFHLTGDRRYLDVATGYAENLAYRTNTYECWHWGVGRASGWSLLVMGSVHKIRPSENIRRAAEIMIDQIISKQDSSGLFHDSKICAKAFTDREIHLCVRGLIRWHQVTGNRRIEKLLLSAMPVIVERAFSESGVPIYGSWPEKRLPTTHSQGYANLESLAYAYYLTGERKYIEAGIGQLGQLIPWIENPNQDEYYGDLWYRIMRGPFPFLQAAHKLGILQDVPGAGAWLTQ